MVNNKVVTLYVIILIRAGGAEKELISHEEESVISDIYHNKLKSLINNKRVKELADDRYVFQKRTSNERALGR